MKLNKIFLIIISVLLLVACSSEPKKTKIRIETDFGPIVVELYDSTVLHKENFIKMIEKGIYDESSFHRIIPEFMIQGGDVENNEKIKNLPDYNTIANAVVPFESYTSYIHKRGAIAAARQGDDINPTKASSATQFYIVQGKKFTNEELNNLELQYERFVKQNIMIQILNEKGRENDLAIFNEAISTNNSALLEELVNKYRDAVQAQYLKGKQFKLSQYQRNIYTTIGGSPHLDGDYSVFGEVISGTEVVDSIASQPRDGADKPLKEIKFKISIID